jgi:transcriptional regulator with XRE-family HTH domain
MDDQFIVWLARELKEKRLSQRELARQSAISQTLISQTLSGDVKPSADFCIKVAGTLGEPPEKLLRLAGILPPGTDDPSLQELLEVARNLSSENQQDLLNYAKFRFKQEQDEKRSKKS